MMVIKVGGGKGIPIEAVCQDVADLVKRGERLILVHGGSHETNELSTALGKPPRFVTSVSGVESRYTDRETLEIFNMAYVGKMNKLFVERLQQLGVNAVGCAGLMAAAWWANVKRPLRWWKTANAKSCGMILPGAWSRSIPIY